MSVPPSSSSDSLSADDRRLQQFLELAAPVLLEEPDVESEETWRELERLAERTGLSGTELRGVVESLRREGVLAGSDSSASRLEADISDEELEAYLAPRRAPRRAVPAAPPIAERWRAAAAAARRDPARFLTGDPANGRSPAELKAQIRAFLQKAEGVIAEQRGLTSRARMLLADLAHSMGLAEGDYDEAMALLRARSQPAGGDSQGPLPSLPSRRPPAPLDAVVRSEIPPADRFRWYLEVAIREKQQTRGYVSESAERKLVEEGARKLGLSPVFARHLVYEVADRCAAPVLSRKEGERDEPLDERLEQFIGRAGPILAQERGATQRAYVLLSAIAGELELSEASFQEGMRLLQTAWVGDRRQEDWQRQRREAWHQYLQESLRKVSGSVVTPPELESLVRLGEHRFGVELSVATAEIREVAAGANVHLIWQEQAESHMRNVIEQALAGRVYVDSTTEQRLIDEGGQWGVSDNEIRRWVKFQGITNHRTRQRERRTATLAVVGGCLATVIAMGSFYQFVFLPQTRALREIEDANPAASAAEISESPDQPDSAPERSPPIEGSATSRGSSSPEPPRRNAWWDDGMRIAWINVRRELSEAELRTLHAVESESAARRAGAYDILVRMVVEGDLDSIRARSIFDFTARVAAREPDEETVTRWLTTALEYVPDARAPLPEDLSEYQRMLLAVRLMAVARMQARELGERGLLIADRLERKLPADVTDETPAAEFERRYVAELARRWHENLSHAARNRDARQIADHWKAIAPTTSRHLQRSEVVKLAAETLRVILPRAGDDWRLFQVYIQNAVFSPDSNHVLRMVEVFQRLRDEEPRRYLAALLLSRAEVSFDDLVRLDDTARLVREALGAPEGLPLGERELTDRWVERGQELLDQVAGSQLSDREIVRQILQLARHASLGMALVRNQPAAAETLAQRPEPGLEEPEDDVPMEPEWRMATPMHFRSPARSEPIHQIAEALRRGSSSSPQRLQVLDVLASSVASSPDGVTAEVAAEVAAYLLSNRSVAEHRERLARVPLLRDSLEMQIALAHALGDVSAQDMAARETIGDFLSEDRELLPTGPDWPRRLRIRMLRDALTRLPHVPAASTETLPLGQLHDQLRSEYREQARLIGIPDEELSDLKKASAVRRRMLESEASAWMSRAEPNSEQEADARRITREIVAVQYVSPHDLALTLLLDRLWLRYLVQEHEAGDGRRGGEVRSVLESLRQSDERAANQVEQLRDTQAALVRLWMLKLREGS